MTTPRPTIGNTYAIGKFDKDGVKGYVPVYQDGEHGPMYETRAEAEADYQEGNKTMECMHCGDTLTNQNTSLCSDFHCVDCLYPPAPPMTIAEALDDLAERRRNDANRPRGISKWQVTDQEARHDW